MLLPRIEKIIEEYKGTVHLAKVDIDDNAEIAMEYGVSSISYRLQSHHFISEINHNLNKISSFSLHQKLVLLTFFKIIISYNLI